jgi:mannose-6-phosphate isomerase
MHEFPYPMLLEGRLDEKIWGGRRLATVLGKRLPVTGRFGESLESDDTARVQNGQLAGSTLAEAVEAHGAGLLGAAGWQASQAIGGFPLLAKFIDAADTLSVQVHPNDQQAAPLSKRGKTEAWHILDAEPGAWLITGLKPGTAVSGLAKAIEENRLEELLAYHPVSNGDTLFIPAGTTHAIGGGILLYEIQQASDVTFRMYDWGRVDDSGRPRDLHVAESLSVVSPELSAQVVVPLRLDGSRTVLTACRYFTLERWTVNGGMPVPDIDRRCFRLVSCVRGGCAVRWPSGTMDLGAGATMLLPAALASCTLNGNATVLVSWVPDLAADVLEPLRDAGYDDERIAALSGALSDLAGAAGATPRQAKGVSNLPPP